LERYATSKSFDATDGYKSYQNFENALKILPHHLLTEDEIMRAYCEYVVGVSREGDTDSQVKQASLAVINVTENLTGWITYNWGQQRKK
jgi:hypothetical protein